MPTDLVQNHYKLNNKKSHVKCAHESIGTFNPKPPRPLVAKFDDSSATFKLAAARIRERRHKNSRRRRRQWNRRGTVAGETGGRRRRRETGEAMAERGAAGGRKTKRRKKCRGEGARGGTSKREGERKRRKIFLDFFLTNTQIED